MRALAVSAVLVVVAVTPLAAQPNRCVECHFANFSGVPASQELVRWDQSAHAKHGVTCDRCHGGDPGTYQPQDAHRGVLASRHPLSSVHGGNLPLTCAACHATVVADYNVSRHASVAAPGAAPTCSTCHSAMGAQRPSASRFEATCAECHMSGAARGEYPALARHRLEALQAIDQTLARVETTIASIDDRNKRNRLAAELLLARAAVRSATDAIHTFDFRIMDEQRAIAQRRAADLVSALIAP